jgi:hypothetical protein
VQKNEIIDNPYFERWTENSGNYNGIEIYIDKMFKNELESNKNEIKINAKSWKYFGQLKGSLHIELI